MQGLLLPSMAPADKSSWILGPRNPLGPRSQVYEAHAVIRNDRPPSLNCLVDCRHNLLASSRQLGKWLKRRPETSKIFKSFISAAGCFF